MIVISFGVLLVPLSVKLSSIIIEIFIYTAAGIGWTVFSSGNATAFVGKLNQIKTTYNNLNVSVSIAIEWWLRRSTNGWYNCR